MRKLLLLSSLFVCSLMWANSSLVNFPGGMIAVSADGNHHDEDDWGANALNIAMLHYAGLEDKLVHYDFNNHLITSKMESWKKENAISIREGMDRFWGDKAESGKAITFDCLTELNACIANFVAKGETASEDNPLWYICAGPMEVPWRCLKALKEKAPDKLQYVHWISHSDWNDTHGTPYDVKNGASPCSQCAHGIKELQRDYPSVNYHKIQDQNKSNSSFDFRDETDGTRWAWLKESKNTIPNWIWLYNRDKKEGQFDVSDAGMMWWLISGATNGGQDNGGTKEMKQLFGAIDPEPIAADQPKIATVPSTVGSGEVISKDGYVVFEAESTTSPLGEWKVISEGDADYVNGSSGYKHLEFTGNNPSTGPAVSPLKYTFTVPKNGTYKMLMRARKRLDGAPGDQCNDCYLKIEGGAVSASSNDKGSMSDAEITQNTKIYGGSANEWGWVFQYVKGSEEAIIPVQFILETGKQYTITISGRSQRFNFDYICLYDKATYNDATGRLIGPGGVNVPDGPAIEVGANVIDPDYFGFEGVIDSYNGYKDGGWWNNSFDNSDGSKLNPKVGWIFNKRAEDNMTPATGSGCLKFIDPEQSGDRQIQTVPTNPGAGINLVPGTYTLSLKVYLPEGNSMDSIHLGFFNDLSDGSTNRNPAIYLNTDTITTTGQWITISKQLLVGGNITGMKVGLHYGGKATTFYLDDFAIVLDSFGNPFEGTPVEKVLWKPTQTPQVYSTGRPSEIKIENGAGNTAQVFNMKGQQILNKRLSSESELLHVPSGIKIVVIENKKPVKVMVR